MSLQLLTQQYDPAPGTFIQRSDEMYAQYSKGGLLIFLRVADVSNPDVRFVYFIVYSMSPKITVYWGVFDKATDDFIFDAGCIANLKNLNVMLTQWKQHGYKYAANIVEDKISPTLAKYKNIRSRRGQILFDYPTYVLFRKVINDLNVGRPITRDDLIDFKAIIFETFVKDPEFKLIDKEYTISLFEPQIDQAFNLRKEEIKRQLNQYERSINRIDIDNDFRQQIAEVKRITNLFFEKIKHGEYFFHDRVTSLCPTINECSRQNNKSCDVYNYGYTVQYIEDLL